MKSLLLGSAVLKAIFPADTPLEQRQKMLRQYFSPVPGVETAVVDPEEISKPYKEKLKIRGYIWVRPPKGRCLIISREKDTLDNFICKPTPLSFRLWDLDQGGKINWLVYQSQNDPGTKLSWQTPYRIANFIPLGRFEEGANIRSPIRSCKATSQNGQRKVTLEFFDGRTWYIPFPQKDMKIAGRKKDRNLYVRVMTNTDGKAHPEDVSSGEPSSITEEDIKRKHKLLALKLSGKYKKEEKKQYSFLIRPWEAYEMNSSHVMESGGPMGLDGTCRYRLKGARFDPSSGVVECFNTDSYDALFTHLSCSSQLQTKPQKTAP